MLRWQSMTVCLLHLLLEVVPLIAHVCLGKVGNAERETLLASSIPAVKVVRPIYNSDDVLPPKVVPMDEIHLFAPKDRWVQWCLSVSHFIKPSRTVVRSGVNIFRGFREFSSDFKRRNQYATLRWLCGRVLWHLCMTVISVSLRREISTVLWRHEGSRQSKSSGRRSKLD